MLGINMLFSLLDYNVGNHLRNLYCSKISPVNSTS